MIEETLHHNEDDEHENRRDGIELEMIDEEEIFQAIYTIINMLTSVDLLAHTCYDGFEKVGFKYYLWGNFAYTTGQPFFNALLHIDSLADDVTGILLFFDEELPWAGPATTVQLGHLFGDIIKSFFDTPRYKDGVNAWGTNDGDMN